MKNRDLVVVLKGGLGNQLFQFAFGKFLEETKGLSVKYVFPKSPDQVLIRHRRMLSIGDLLSHDSLDQGSVNPLIFQSFLRWRKSHWWIEEANINHSIEDLITTRTHYVSGYFQQYRYVEAAWKEIWSQMSVATGSWKAVGAELSARIAVHVRLGDYFDTPRVRDFHGVCHPAYYFNAIRELREVLQIDEVLVVTDDVSKARALLNPDNSLGKSLTFTSSADPVIDLSLLANSRGVIASNSTFSWWGGYLAHRLFKSVVVVPYPWFSGDPLEPEFLIPKSWLQRPRTVL